MDPYEDEVFQFEEDAATTGVWAMTVATVALAAMAVILHLTSKADDDILAICRNFVIFGTLYCGMMTGRAYAGLRKIRKLRNRQQERDL